MEQNYWNTTFPVCLIIFICIGCLSACSEKPEPVAATANIAEFMEQFEGRGAQSDQSILSSPQAALAKFRTAEDLRIDLVLAEPKVHQPVELSFDHRGRLWVVQYSQYPYPKGLKVTGIDHHIRMTFDKKPEPPPRGEAGADKITVYEDTDGDGTFDKATDAITGLNIATSVCWGRGQIWVLNPPYLLAYPDPDGDGLPNGYPEVHIDGFGLEDTHAVANSLRWGPDGWLYGAQGSTTTAVINTENSKDIRFNGQVIWRYHPSQKVFEIFAEGGGNTFHVEIDAKGRIYSGTNGTTRGQYYKQGAYYKKNWGKHGALTNPYAFGFLRDMDFTGEKIRFTHAWIKYEGGTLPSRFDGQVLAINPLHNYVQLSYLKPNGSTFATEDDERILSTPDRWFRPVDIKAGPDGSVYLADWCDSRLSHVNPKDDWHKQSGRIYRISGNTYERVVVGDLSKLNNDSLILLLSHPNKWFRQQALRQFGDRQDQSVLPALQDLLMQGDAQTALEALWAIHLSGGWNDEVAGLALDHEDPFVRMWGVRLCGDYRQVNPAVSSRLKHLARIETHPEVISQLAASAKRFPAALALPIFEHLSRQIDPADPDNPLLLWWALENQIEGNQTAVANIFKTSSFWDNPVIKRTILERLMQRLIMEGGKHDYILAKSLLQLAFEDEYAEILIDGLLKGMRDKSLLELPPDFLETLQPLLAQYGEGPLALDLRKRDPEAILSATSIIQDANSPLSERLAYIRIMGNGELPASVDALLKVVENRQTAPVVIKTALQALSAYEDREIGKRLLEAYPDHLRAEPDIRQASLYTLASRTDWSIDLLEQIQIHKRIHPSDLPPDIVTQLLWSGDKKRQTIIREIWPEVLQVGSEEKEKEFKRISELVQERSGDQMKGKALFSNLCASCHQLFGQGSDIGPDLTGYDRQNIPYLSLHIVDPNLDIREGYVNYGLHTKDGRFFSGVIQDQTSRQVSIRQFGGEVLTFDSQQIDSLVAQPFSLMPERLLNQLSDVQIRDLFAYLMAEENF